MMATDKDVDDTSGSCHEIYDAPRVDRTRAFLFGVAFATLCNLSPQCTSRSTEPQLLVTTAMLLDFRLTYQRLPVQSA